MQVELDQRGLAIRQKPRRIAVRRQPWKVSEKVAVVKAVATGSRVIISASRSRGLVCHWLGSVSRMNAEEGGSRIRKMSRWLGGAGPLTLFDHPGGGYPRPGDSSCT